jgi:sRNA-binding protein
MIENKQEISKDLEKALQVLQQAKQRVANEKKKQNEKKRKAEKPLPHKPLSPMPEVKARAVWNDEDNGTEKLMLYNKN